jgi:adenylylsulfate kinase
MVIWIIGLAGAGKTSLGQALYSLLAQRNNATVFLDGDHVRQIMGNDLGHSTSDREKNGWRICHMCKWLETQDINVVCCVLSMFPEQRAWNREHFSRYFEVFLDVSMDVLEKRDQKGLYSGARSGKIKNVVGVDLPFPGPGEADLTINNDKPCSNFRAKIETIVKAIDNKWPEI